HGLACCAACSASAFPLPAMHRLVMNDSVLEIPGYTVHRQLGKGGMADVYLATQESLQRKVAIKVLHAEADESFSERFVKEAHIVASLRHPGIITIHDVDRL